MSDRRLSPKHFVWPSVLIATRAMTFDGNELVAGDKIPLGEEDKGKALRIWMTGRAVYEEHFNPTPINSAPLTREFRITKGGNNGYYLIDVPWLDEPLSIKGKKKAEDERDRLQSEGEPLSHHGVAILGDGKGGWYGVKADWIDAEIKAQGMEAAYFIATNLRTAGPFPVEAAGIGKVEVDHGQYAVVYPWMEEVEYCGSIQEAEAFEQRLREAGPPSDEDEDEQAILDALEGGEAPAGGDTDPVTEEDETEETEETETSEELADDVDADNDAHEAEEEE